MRKSLIHRDKYLTFMGVHEICTFMIDLKYYIFLELENKFQNLMNDIELQNVYKKAKDEMKLHGILNYILLENNQKEYLKSCPCSMCKSNQPCDMCRVITPFDALNVKGPYRMACKKGVHICLKCKINN